MAKELQFEVTQEPHHSVFIVSEVILHILGRNATLIHCCRRYKTSNSDSNK